MAILMMSKYTEHYVDPERWRRALAKQIPDLDFRVWPDVGDYESIEMVLGDFAPPGLLKQFPNLKLISYLGYGVDALFKDRGSVGPLHQPDQVLQHAFVAEPQSYQRLWR